MQMVHVAIKYLHGKQIKAKHRTARLAHMLEIEISYTTINKLKLFYIFSVSTIILLCIFSKSSFTFKNSFWRPLIYWPFSGHSAISANNNKKKPSIFIWQFASLQLAFIVMSCVSFHLHQNALTIN